MSGSLDILDIYSTYDPNPPMDLVLPLNSNSASIVSSLVNNASPKPGPTLEIDETSIFPKLSDVASASKNKPVPLEDSANLSLQLPASSSTPSCIDETHNLLKDLVNLPLTTTSAHKALEIPLNSGPTRSMFPDSGSGDMTDEMTSSRDKSTTIPHYASSLCFDGKYYSYDGFVLGSKNSTRPFAYLEEEEEEGEEEEPTIDLGNSVPRYFLIPTDGGLEGQRPFTHYELRGKGFGFLPIIPDPVVIADVEEDEDEEVEYNDPDEGWGMKLRSRVKRYL